MVLVQLWDRLNIFQKNADFVTGKMTQVTNLIFNALGYKYAAMPTGMETLHVDAS